MKERNIHDNTHLWGELTTEESVQELVHAKRETDTEALTSLPRKGSQITVKFLLVHSFLCGCFQVFCLFGPKGKKKKEKKMTDFSWLRETEFILKAAKM